MSWKILGREIVKTFTAWADNSMEVFGNKWFLLRVLYSASIEKKYNDSTIELYEALIKMARDHGLVHEMAIAFELLGDYLVLHGQALESKKNFEKSYTCYSQWGAVAIADRLLRDHDLDITTLADDNLHIGTNKHSRQERID